MEIKELSYLFSGRDIDPFLKPSQFWVERNGIYNISELNNGFDCHNGYDFYFVNTGLLFNKKVADNAVQLAKEKGVDFLIDDLDESFGDSKYLHSHVSRLAHALEHLTCIDLFNRNLLPRQAIESMSAEKTFALRSGSRKRIGFFFRDELVDLKEKDTSVQNAVDQVRQLK